VSRRTTPKPESAEPVVTKTCVFPLADLDRLTAILTQARGMVGLISVTARGEDVAEAAYAIAETAWGIGDMIDEAAALLAAACAD
jgi:hypothetical protein